MVKITNTFGDVKIGKQGEVVYQRKYGEQMRRMVSPKRAIASTAQEKHRQLYKTALDWRKGLSRPNRRYLEGYCIANGVVDRYLIPLAWSRFALKLYLEHVHFVLVDKPIAGKAGEAAKFESYEEGDTTQRYIFAQYWNAQSFTPQISHSINKVVLKLYRLGTPPISRVGIYNVDGNHVPSGSELTGVNADFSWLTEEVAGEWAAVTLPAYPLIAETEYAIVLSNPDGSAANRLFWRMTNFGDIYDRGIGATSSNSGTSWLAKPGEDRMFQEWGATPPTLAIPGLLHVKHPALLRVVQKRGELTVSEYKKLSSLDEEYLTKQVGIDVLSGDLIEATTLPGIKYTYEV